jgi:4-aminobutyrate aminotransferase-like enzyme
MGKKHLQFGSNPVSCAAVLAVLRVLRTEKLQQNAQSVGAHFMRQLRELQSKHKCMGDVR